MTLDRLLDELAAAQRHLGANPRDIDIAVVAVELPYHFDEVYGPIDIRADHLTVDTAGLTIIIRAEL